MVVCVEPKGWDGDKDAVKSLDHAEDEFRLHFLGVEVLLRTEYTELTGHMLGQVVHPVLLVLGQISDVKR